MASSTPKGISFPFRFTNSGGVKKSEGVNKVVDNMIALALANKGERVVRGDVGTIGYSLVLRNFTDDESLGIIRDVIREALTKYERRAFIRSIRIFTEDTKDGRGTFLDIGFIYKETGEVSSFKKQIA